MPGESCGVCVVCVKKIAKIGSVASSSSSRADLQMSTAEENTAKSAATGPPQKQDPDEKRVGCAHYKRRAKFVVSFGKVWGLDRLRYGGIQFTGMSSYLSVDEKAQLMLYRCNRKLFTFKVSQ